MMQRHIEVALTEIERLFEILISDATGEYFYTIFAANEVEAIALAQQAHIN